METSKKTPTRFIPDNAVEQAYPAAGVVVYRYTTPTRFIYLAYQGRKEKPVKHDSFLTEERREQFLADWIKRETEVFARKQERKQVEHGLQAGDILYTTWGYEQTNADFYQVVRVPSARSVVVREIEAVITASGSQSMSGTAMPKIGVFSKDSSEVLRRAVQLHSVTNGKHGGWLRKWEGLPVSVSWYG